MTFNKPDMDKTLKNGLSMIETDPLNHKWLDLVGTRCWVAAHMCSLSHFRSGDVRAEVRAEWGLEMCV